MLWRGSNLGQSCCVMLGATAKGFAHFPYMVSKLCGPTISLSKLCSIRWTIFWTDLAAPNNRFLRGGLGYPRQYTTRDWHLYEEHRAEGLPKMSHLLLAISLSTFLVHLTMMATTVGSATWLSNCPAVVNSGLLEVPFPVRMALPSTSRAGCTPFTGTMATTITSCPVWAFGLTRRHRPRPHLSGPAHLRLPDRQPNFLCECRAMDMVTSMELTGTMDLHMRRFWASKSGCGGTRAQSEASRQILNPFCQHIANPIAPPLSTWQILCLLLSPHGKSYVPFSQHMANPIAPSLSTWQILCHLLSAHGKSYVPLSQHMANSMSPSLGTPTHICPVFQRGLPEQKCSLGIAALEWMYI
jgi:hypothetical protein